MASMTNAYRVEQGESILRLTEPQVIADDSGLAEEAVLFHEGRVELRMSVYSGTSLGLGAPVAAS
jgi:hypothetical protein